MLESFRIPVESLLRLADHPADPETVTVLMQGQLSKNIQLAAHIAKSAPNALGMANAVSVFSQAQSRDPAISDRLAAAPCFGSWAARAVSLLGGTTRPHSSLAVELSYLHATAAVAAMWTRVDADLTLYVRDGMVLLPTMGAVRVAAADLTPVRARVRGGGMTLQTDDLTVEVSSASVDTAAWLPLRAISAEAAGHAITLTVDDLDPYRDCYHKQLAARLSEEEFRHGERLMRDAWQLLTEYAPERAVELAAGMRTMVPLSVTHAAPGLSATSRVAVGALALTLPERAVQLAVTLVHEFQHSKLSALLDLVPLHAPGSGQLYFAAWKPEPRPVWGLLQGSYAFLAVAELWWRLRDAPVDRVVAQRHFAEIRLQVDDVLSTLESVPDLNGNGRVFVSRMRSALDSLLAVPVPADVAREARLSLERTRAQWARRHDQALVTR